MARTSIRAVIDRAHEIISRKAVDQDLTGGETQRALDILNRLLATYSNVSVQVPYFVTISFTLSAGKAEYVIKPTGGDVDSNKIAYLESVQIRDGNVLYALGNSITPDAYYNTDRSLTTSVRPSKVFLQQTLDSSKIIFLPTPNNTFQAELTAKFDIFPVSINDDLETYVPASWDNFIILDLASNLVAYYPASKWDDNLRKLHSEAKSNISTGSDKDPHVDYDPRLASLYSYDYYGRF